MDWKAKLDDLSRQTDDLLKQAEAKYQELKKSADADGDGIPDALQSAMTHARGAADSAKARFAALQVSLAKEADAMPDRLDALTKDAEEALDRARARVAELSRKAADRVEGAKTPGHSPDDAA